VVAYVFRELVRGGTKPRAVRALAQRLAIDERTLRRRCVRALGYGPKTLDRILRFRRALRLGRAGLPAVEVAAAAGYADQAHLSRECRRLAGVGPGALFTSAAVMVTANG
jgi:transcriptional regulator GlxA family with amidase domain